MTIGEIILFIIHVIFCLLTAMCARWRGYSPFVWLFASFFSHPLVIVMFLWLPDRNQMKLRAAEHSRLRQQLAAQRRHGGAIWHPGVPGETIGEAMTRR